MTLRGSARRWILLGAATALASGLPVAGAAPGVCSDDLGGSSYAIQFHEPDSVPGADRILIPLLDDRGEPTAADIGAGSFTIELWIKGDIDEQIRPQAGYRPPGQSVASFDWVTSNILVDRSVYHRRYPVFGAGFHRDGDPGDEHSDYDRAVLRFGVRSGTGAGADHRYTIQGKRHVLDGNWHHVALVRDAVQRELSILVDGQLDARSDGDVRPTGADLSYPNGAERDPDVRNAARSPYLVVGTEKHDLGRRSPGFRGNIDELRLWRRARTPAEIAADYHLAEPLDRDGLVAHFRFESGEGNALRDSVSGMTAIYRPGDRWRRRNPWTRDAAPVNCAETDSQDIVDVSP